MVVADTGGVVVVATVELPWAEEVGTAPELVGAAADVIDPDAPADDGMANAVEAICSVEVAMVVSM